MRRAPLGVVVSVAVHAALLALVHAYQPAPRSAPELPPVVELIPVEVAPPPPPPPPLDIALAEPPPEPDPELRRLPEPRAPLARPPAAAVSTTTASAAEVAPALPADPTTAPPARSPWFDLRRPPGPTLDLRLPRTTPDGLERVPRGTDADRGVAPTGQLRDAGGGNLRSDQGPFVAKVAPDGGVTLTDRRNVRFRVALPSPRALGNSISRWYYSDKGADGQRGERSLEKNVNGSIDAEDRSRAVIVPVIGGGFDVTDAIMRRKHQDPYASKKLAFLDSTRDERVQLGAAHRAQQLRQTTQLVQRNLDQLWQRVADPRARRAALFELWDEVVEDGDAAVVEAGRAARSLVVGFIRARLPAGGPDAYTADELGALNRRRQSKASFAPYE